MEWLLRSFQKIKKRSTHRTNRYKNTAFEVQTWDRSNHHVFREEEKLTREGNLFRNLRMRLKKKCKLKSTEVSKPVKPISSILKKSKSVRTKIIYPKIVKRKPDWVHRLLNNNKLDESFGEYIHKSPAEETEPVHKIYSSHFMQCDHFNLVGEEQHLGPVVLSIMYFSQTKEAAISKTNLILRLPTGMAHHQWNQFQLSHASNKSPLDLVKLAFPSLSVGKLLPVICPDAWQAIACYDETDGGDEAAFDESKDKDWSEDQKVEVAKRDRELKALQVKLITGTCKFLELSVWDFEAYENFFSKKKPICVPKYLSFTMPNVMKTPKALKSSNNVKSPSFNMKSPSSVKSPNFMRVTKSLLQIGNDQSLKHSSTVNIPRISGLGDLSIDLDKIFDMPLAVSETTSGLLEHTESIPPMLAIKYLGDFSRHSAATSTVASILEPDLNDRLLDLSIESFMDDPLGTDDPGLATDDNDDVVLMKMKLTLIKFKMERDDLLEKKFTLEKENEKLKRNEKRLVRELASAKTIIDNLKDKVSR